MRDPLFVVGGLVLLTVAADRFVMGAARLSTALRVSAVIVGAVVIGFGTSAPELLVTCLATLQGSQDLAFGNVVGSNTANVLLILGVSALLRPLRVSGPTLRRELPLMVLAVALLAAVTLEGRVTTRDAVVLLVAAAVFVWLIVHTALRDRQSAAALEAEVAEYEAGNVTVSSSLLLAVAGLVGTLGGAQLLVLGATGLARTLGVTEAVIGLTIVAVGTSLPELVTAVAAARRDEPDLVIGNVLGSNIFNSLPVAGLAGLLDTVQLHSSFTRSLFIMVAACAVLAALLGLRGRIGRPGGAVLVAMFAVATWLTV
ncbi:MAG: calcium/sodium antiporter [Nitriliruptorales bacterium]|nr:calcium/sodium antiporter [Nitriliruptorales bacterium]